MDNTKAHEHEQVMQQKEPTRYFQHEAPVAPLSLIEIRRQLGWDLVLKMDEDMR